MIQTLEAVIDEQGAIRLLQNVQIQRPRRALVTILEEEPLSAVSDSLLSEDALAEDWNRPEEEEAWSYLQPEK